MKALGLGVHGELQPLQDVELYDSISIFIEGMECPEHSIQSHKAADEAVEVDVHVLVSIAHRDDVVELVVQPKPCIFDCIAHLIAVNGS